MSETPIDIFDIIMSLRGSAINRWACSDHCVMFSKRHWTNEMIEEHFRNCNLLDRVTIEPAKSPWELIKVKVKDE